MLYGEHWGALACHSGDMGFDSLFMGDFPKSVTHLEKHGGIEGFLEHVKSTKKMSHDDFHVLMMVAMGAFYDPDPDGPMGIRLPVDLRTCVLDETRWAEWLKNDPVIMIDRNDVQENLKSLKGIFIDCGFRDQYNLHFGARQLSDKMNKLGIKHIHEEFDDNHSSVDYRMDVSFPFIYNSLTE